jgi:hypothetical protein
MMCAFGTSDPRRDSFTYPYKDHCPRQLRQHTARHSSQKNSISHLAPPFTPMSTPLNASHVADTLQRLQVQQDQSIQYPETGEPPNPLKSDPPHNSSPPRTPITREGYGFRKSGISTPIGPSSTHAGSQISQDALVPDPNGLGWPGAPFTSINPRIQI